jgi:hypothetical protein
VDRDVPARLRLPIPRLVTAFWNGDGNERNLMRRAHWVLRDRAGDVAIHLGHTGLAGDGTPDFLRDVRSLCPRTPPPERDRQRQPNSRQEPCIGLGHDRVVRRIRADRRADVDGGPV